MTAPHIVDPSGLLGEALAEASPDLMRSLLQDVINSLLSPDADAVAGVNGDGHRDVLGMRVATSETGAAWKGFFADLVARSLAGVRLVTSDAHAGLVEAIAAHLPGAAWQRCRIHHPAPTSRARAQASRQRLRARHRSRVAAAFNKEAHTTTSPPRRNPTGCCWEWAAACGREPELPWLEWP